jgi:DNA-binding NarL/FixJ family response regulator
MSGAASARVRAPSKRWLLVRRSMLKDGADARTAVLLEAAQAPELAPLIADGYGLTQRERTVTQLVAQGASTDEIAAGCTCPRTRCRTTSRRCSTRSE